MLLVKFERKCGAIHILLYQVPNESDYNSEDNEFKLKPYLYQSDHMKAYQ